MLRREPLVYNLEFTVIDAITFRLTTTSSYSASDDICSLVLIYFYISCWRHSFLIYYYMASKNRRYTSESESDSDSDSDSDSGGEHKYGKTNLDKDFMAEAYALQAAAVEAAAKEQFEAKMNETVEKVYRVINSKTLWAICFATGCAIYSWQNGKLTEPPMGGGKTVRKYKRKSKSKGKGKSKKGRN
jgi:hypothetical protein